MNPNKHEFTSKEPMEYRILREGEIIEADDECDACADGWRDMPKWQPVPPHMIGRKASNPAYPSHTKYRRRQLTNQSPAVQHLISEALEAEQHYTLDELEEAAKALQGQTPQAIHGGSEKLPPTGHPR